MKELEAQLQEALNRISALEDKQMQSYVQDTNLFVDIQNIINFVQVVSTAPTATPRNFWEQIKLYINGATYRLYIYDNITNNWRYATLT